jgi:MoaA/NifB/PqqE/SkfB family radical SAM enzyme
MNQAIDSVQIEITTICNFTCQYCAGRNMPQQHMEEETLQNIFNSLPVDRSILISLQGEGEPMLHPRFWDWAEAFMKKGHKVTTISNGSRIDAKRCSEHLTNIGISLDTLDPSEAERIGRHNLPKVLQNLDSLLAHMGAHRIRIHTVNYGQELQPLKDYLLQRGIYEVIVQPIQIKNDYASRYEGLSIVQVLRQRQRPLQRFNCRYLDGRIRMRYVNLNGIEMPCPYIKNTTQFESTDQLRAQLVQQLVPQACTGCRELY